MRFTTDKDGYLTCKACGWQTRLPNKMENHLRKKHPIVYKPVKQRPVKLTDRESPKDGGKE